MYRNTETMIVFINKHGEGIFIENPVDDWDSFEFEVREAGIVDESLLEVDGYGNTSRLDMEKAFQPLKFYEIVWWEDHLQTPDGDSYYCVLESLKEIDYINQGS